jgi:hypothetical protein
MSDKPSYLGLLNAIALAERGAHCYLTAWIEMTTDPVVCATLRTVAAREGEHAMAFAKRIDELGYTLREKEDPGFDKRLSIAKSKLSDLEKMKKLGLHRLNEDVLGLFDDVFKDHSIDIRTGELLGRYIAEEYDTARLLRACYEQLKARGTLHAIDGAGAAERLAAIDAKVDALCRAVDELRQIVCAQTMPTQSP